MTSSLGQPFNSDLQNLIENAYNLNGQTPVVLMGHSSGTFMIYSFLYRMSQAWKSKYVAAAVSLAGDYSGQGYMVEHSVIGWSPLNVDYLSIRNITQTWLNIPQKYASSYHYRNITLMQTPSRNYTGADIPEILQVIGLDLLVKIYPLIEAQLPNPYPTHPGVDLYCLWGTGFNTALGPIYSNDNFDQYPSGQITVNGDGVHEEYTNSACLVWQNSTEFSFKYESFPGVDHGGITVDPVALSNIVAYVQQLSW